MGEGSVPCRSFPPTSKEYCASLPVQNHCHSYKSSSRSGLLYKKQWSFLFFHIFPFIVRSSGYGWKNVRARKIPHELSCADVGLTATSTAGIVQGNCICASFPAIPRCVLIWQRQTNNITDPNFPGAGGFSFHSLFFIPTTVQEELF